MTFRSPSRPPTSRELAYLLARPSAVPTRAARLIHGGIRSPGDGGAAGRGQRRAHSRVATRRRGGRPRGRVVTRSALAAAGGMCRHTHDTQHGAMLPAPATTTRMTTAATPPAAARRRRTVAAAARRRRRGRGRRRRRLAEKLEAELVREVVAIASADRCYFSVVKTTCPYMQRHLYGSHLVREVMAVALQHVVRACLRQESTSEQASKRASEQASKRASEQASKRASEQAKMRATVRRPRHRAL